MNECSLHDRISTEGISLWCQKRQVYHKRMFRVQAKYLLLIAAAVWFLAGINIARIGVSACAEGVTPLWLLIVGIPAVFLAFHTMFSKLVGKHADRIRSYGEDRMHILRFFDVKGYIIMAVMMGGGISLRAFGIVPSWFVAFFYTAGLQHQHRQVRAVQHPVRRLGLRPDALLRGAA